MAGSDTNELSPGEDSRRLLGSQVATEAAANLMWRGAKDFAGNAWNLIKAPGQILEGSLVPSMEPGPNQLSIPEYALGLAGTGMGITAPLRLAAGGAADLGTLEHFPAWHGTGAKPFQEFSDDFIGTGEGAQIRGYGHYVAGARKTGEIYRNQIAGRGEVPVDEEGFPLSDTEVWNKYYEPGTIVKGYGGYDKVLSSEAGPDMGGRYNVRVQQVYPNVDLLDNPEELAKLSPGAQETLKFISETGQISVPGIRAGGMSDLVNSPDAWRNAVGSQPRTHSTFPDYRDIQSIGRVRGWDMGQPGGLLHINVVPEEHELLDLDLPFNRQTPDIQEKLTAANLHPDGIRDTADRHGLDTSDISEYMTGDELYKQHVANYRESGFAWGDEAPRFASKDLENAGIPGLKFLDASSRHKSSPAVSLAHNTGYIGAPGGSGPGSYVDQYLGTHRSMNAPIDTIMEQRIRQMQSDAAIMSGNAPVNELRNPNSIHPIVANVRRLNNLADWTQREYRAGNFSLKQEPDTRTRNYVIFDPKNLEIRTWNGRPLTPVEGDPFDVTRP